MIECQATRAELGAAAGGQSTLSFPRTRESRALNGGSLDTRFRGYDNVRVTNYNSAFLGSPTMNSRVPGSTEFNKS